MSRYRSTSPVVHGLWPWRGDPCERSAASARSIANSLCIRRGVGHLQASNQASPHSCGSCLPLGIATAPTGDRSDSVLPFLPSRAMESSYRFGVIVQLCEFKQCLLKFLCFGGQQRVVFNHTFQHAFSFAVWLQDPLATYACANAALPICWQLNCWDIEIDSAEMQRSPCRTSPHGLIRLTQSQHNAAGARANRRAARQRTTPKRIRPMEDLPLGRKDRCRATASHRRSCHRSESERTRIGDRGIAGLGQQFTNLLPAPHLRCSGIRVVHDPFKLIRTPLIYCRQPTKKRRWWVRFPSCCSQSSISIAPR